VTAAEQRNAAGVVCGAVALTLVFFHRALLSNEAFLARDMLLVYLPLRSYWVQRVLSGSFPDWYPYDGLGQPFSGMLISAPFHPLNVVYLLLPLKAALNLNVLLCFPTAFGGVYALARRFGGGVAPAVLGGLGFAFSGALVSSTNNLSYLMAAATVPWALWGADRFLQRPSWGRASLTGGLAALVLLAGDIQAFALTLALLVILAFCRRARPIAAGVLVTSALAAGMVQLIPAWQAISQAQRGQQTLAQVTRWSTHPLRLLEVLVGPAFARDVDDPLGRLIARRLLDSGQGTLWMDSLYLGLPAVVLALFGAWTYRRSRTGWTLTLFTVVLLLLALGKRAGLTALAYYLVPFWRAFRYPEKWMALVSLGMALGAVAGFEAVLRRPPARRWAGRLLAASGVLALVFGAEEAWLGRLGQWMSDRIGSAALSADTAARFSGDLARGAAISGVLAVLTATTLLWARRPQVIAWSVPACCFLGLLWLNEPRYQLASADVVEHPSSFLGHVVGTPWRVLQLTGAHRLPIGTGLSAMDRHAFEAIMELEPVTPALFGVDGANTYLPAGSSRVFELSDDERAWVLERAGLFATRYLSVADGNVAGVVGAGKRVVETLPAFGYTLLEDMAALPRAYVARPVCVADAAESLAAVQARRFVRGVEAVVECSSPLPAGTGTLGEVLSLECAPERVALTVKATSASVVVLNDAFYSGWRVKVDGAEQPILAANHAVRGVFVQPGKHEIVFSYRTPGLWWGLSISLFFLLGGAIAAALGRSHFGSSAKAALFGQ
jgi:hypothetical protein